MSLYQLRTPRSLGHSPWSSTLSRIIGKTHKVSERPKEDQEKTPASSMCPKEKFFNFMGCLIVSISALLIRAYSGYVVFIDIGFSIFLAEICEQSNTTARRMFKGVQRYDEKDKLLDMAEKGGHKQEDLNASDVDNTCIASIVGYREDPSIFTSAIQSYAQAAGCGFVLACIDGNDIPDQEMVDVFKNVFPESSTVLDFQVPFAEIAMEMDRSNVPHDDIIKRCVLSVKRTFVENNLQFGRQGTTKYLCVTQPHMHKKGIMFTSFIVSLALSELLDIDFLWTSDSDSIIFKDTLTLTFNTIAGDPNCAGASTALTIHNHCDSIITRLSSTAYFNDLHLSRCYGGSVGVNDCQSGPCAAFRIECIRQELIPWYKQTVLGHRMIINEDRHFTTRLLLRGNRVRFIPNAVTATETPVTLRRWVLQQVRWGRSGHIETFASPSIYLIQHPLLFLGALRRQLVPMVNFIEVLRYVFTGDCSYPSTLLGYAILACIKIVYLKVRNPARPPWDVWFWSIPAGLFYDIPLPAIQIWSLITVFADSWGTSMRGMKGGERTTRWHATKQKIWEMGFYVVWMGIAAGAIGRFVGTSMAWQQQDVHLSILVCTLVTWCGLGSWVAITE